MSESIIEKLGIKPLESHPVRNGFICDALEVRMLERQRNELLEALIEAIPALTAMAYHETVYKDMNLIEKIVEKPWQEIKDLIG